MRVRPAQFTWTEDGVMAPLGRFLPLCWKQYAVGEVYALGPVEGISQRSRGHLFASISEAWKNLPEEDTRFPTSEHLRKWALVQTGYCTHRDFVMDTPQDAKKMAAAIRAVDEYAVITVKGKVVRMYQAESMASTSMTGERFNNAKRAVLDLVASLARTTRDELERHARDGGAR